MSDSCGHTGKPHRWVRIGKVTSTSNGPVEWWHCRSCGVAESRDLPVGHA